MPVDTTVPSTLNGFYKIIQGELENYRPNSVFLQKSIGFKTAAKLGRAFEFPVVTAGEEGLTFGAGDSDALEINDAVSMRTENVSVNGSLILGEARLGYVAAKKAASSKQAFGEIVPLKIKELMNSIRRQLEVALMHGGSSLGTTTGAASAASAQGDGTYRTTVALLPASTAPAFWTRKGMKVVFYNASNVVKGGYSGAVGKAVTAGVYSVVSFDPTPANPTVTLEGPQADIATLVTDSAAALSVYRFGTVSGTAGGFTSLECLGVSTIMQKQTGTVFGIDVAANDVWRSTVVNVAGNISVAAILNAAAKANARGLEDDVIIFINPEYFNGLVTGADILGKDHRGGKEYNAKLAELGVEGITLHGLNGKIEVVSNPFCKKGEAVAIVPSLWQRIGACDLDMKDPAGRDGEVFIHSESKMAYLIRGMSHQAIAPKQLAKAGFIMTGITGVA